MGQLLASPNAFDELVGAGGDHLLTVAGTPYVAGLFGKTVDGRAVDGARRDLNPL